MKILFLHGWNSVPGGVKPSYLIQHGHDVINPKLSDEIFEEAVRTAQTEFDRHHPAVVVGSSRGGAVAMNIKSGDARLVLLCPAWIEMGNGEDRQAGYADPACESRRRGAFCRQCRAGQEQRA